MVAVPACLVHPAHRYGVSGFAVGAGARGCVLCWGAAGGALPVVVCCVSCFVHMDCYRRCACSVVANLCCDFLFATPDASCALCPVLPCAAQLDVSNLLTRMAEHHRTSCIHWCKVCVHHGLQTELPARVVLLGGLQFRNKKTACQANNRIKTVSLRTVPCHTEWFLLVQLLKSVRALIQQNSLLEALKVRSSFEVCYHGSCSVDHVGKWRPPQKLNCSF